MILIIHQVGGLPVGALCLLECGHAAHHILHAREAPGAEKARCNAAAIPAAAHHGKPRVTRKLRKISRQLCQRKVRRARDVTRSPLTRCADVKHERRVPRLEPGPQVTDAQLRQLLGLPERVRTDPSRDVIEADACQIQPGLQCGLC